MSWWSAVVEELLRSYTAFIFLGLIFTAALIRLRDLDERRRVRLMTVFFGLHVVLAVIAGVCKVYEPAGYNSVHLASLMLAAMAVVGMAVTILFSVFLPKIGIKSPPILRDVVGAGALFLAFLVLAGQAGINVSGLIATSAVLTAVVGLSLQDTLGNLMAGLALQSDQSVRVGDWVRVDGIWGQVLEMRWRYTAIETRDWETLIVPNSHLVKGHVMVLGRNKAKPPHWRRWVYFNVDFRYPPQDVIDCVTEALSAARIPGVALTPAADCIVRSFEESYAKYAVRYYLSELRTDDPIDSEVRSVIHAALKRANIPLSIPAAARFVTNETISRATKKREIDLGRRAAVLGKIDLFRELPEDERHELASRMRHAPFVAGEILTRQGAEGHELFLLEEGTASVRISTSDGVEREVARLRPGEVFGEMSLMTGAKRTATVVALTDVEAYRLDKEAFERVLQKRPEIADHFAGVLAQRQIELAAVQENLDFDTKRNRILSTKRDLVDRIRGFFGLDLED